jgi:hypothetical protein
MSSSDFATEEENFFLEGYLGRFNASSIIKNHYSNKRRYNITFSEKDYKNSRFKEVVNVPDEQDGINRLDGRSLLILKLPDGGLEFMSAKQDICPIINYEGNDYHNCCLPIALLCTGKQEREICNLELQKEAFVLKQHFVNDLRRMNDVVDCEDIVKYYESHVVPWDILVISHVSYGKGDPVLLFDWFCRGEHPDPATTLYIHYTPSSVQGGAGHYSPYLLV